MPSDILKVWSVLEHCQLSREGLSRFSCGTTAAEDVLDGYEQADLVVACL